MVNIRCQSKTYQTDLPRNVCPRNPLHSWRLICISDTNPARQSRKIFNYLNLKECYRIGKKQKLWRSQIYIKLTRSNDDDSRKHPMKYFCLKCHIWWELNNLISHLEFIAQVSVLFSFVLESMQGKTCNRFFTILSRPRWPIDLKLLQVCQFMWIT
jgi:hypothetical protein